MRSSLLCLLLWLIASAPAAAQMPIEVDGVILGIRGNVVAIKDNAGKIYQAELSRTFKQGDVIIRFPMEPSINVTGTEDPANLKPGLVIQFQVILRNKRFAESEVSQVTIVTPTAETQAGILLADPVEAPQPEDGKEARPGVYEDCQVLGQIIKARNGLLTVAFLNAERKSESISIKLAEDAAVGVSGNNFSLVRIGDKIHARGTAFVLPHFIAHEVTIEHSPAVDPRKLEKPEIVEGKPGEKPDPFAVGDPAMKPVGEKPKVKLEILKVN